MDTVEPIEYDPKKGTPFDPAATNHSDKRVVCYVNHQENKVCLGVVGHSKCPKPVTAMVNDPEDETFEGRIVDFKGCKPLSDKWWTQTLKLASIVMTVIRNSGASVDGVTVRLKGLDLNASKFAINFQHSFGQPKMQFGDPKWRPSPGGAKATPKKKVARIYG